MNDENIPVRFDGLDLMWLKHDDGSGALAPLRHVDDDGHVTFDAVFGGEDSYAHVMSDGTIMRYHEKIGTVDDLEFLPKPKTEDV